MIPYIFVFIISLFFISGASKFANQKKKIAFYFLSLGSILFPVLLAAYRDSSVGTDVQSYVISIWEDAKIVDGDIQILMERWPHIEVLYLILNSFCSKLSSDFSFLLFVIQLFIITPVFVGAMRTRNIAPPVFVMFIYYCLFYNESYNMVRQSIALSFAFLALLYLLTAKWKYSLCFSFIALGFHYSAIIVFLFYPLYYFVNKYPIQKYKKTYLCCIVGCLFFILFVDRLFIIIINMSILDEKFLAYTSLGGVFDARISKSQLFVKFVIMLYFLLFVFGSYRNSKYLTFFFLISLMDVLFVMTGLIVSFLARIAFYPQILACLSLPYTLHSISCYTRIGNSRYRIPFVALFYLLFIYYWFSIFIVKGVSDTYPYSSKILGI